MKYKVLTLFLFFKVVIIGAQFSPFSESQRYHAPDLFKKPDISTLGTYGNLEVNLAEGKPNVDLNVYTINIDPENSFDIHLNYDTALNRPDATPSWTGLGWNLSSGGLVTRSLRGEVDEIDGNAYYFNPGAYLGAADWDSYGKMQTYISNSKYMERIASPDIFYFNVNGLQGSFFKNHEGKWIVKCNEQDVIVSDVLRTNDLGMQSFIYSFTITDSKGNTYTFGNSPESIERYKLRKKYILNAEYYDYVKNWHLTSIKYNSNKNLTFSYNQVGRIYNKQTFGNYKRHSFKNWVGYVGCANNIDPNNCFNLASYEEGDLSYLSKITFDASEIIFNRSIANSLEIKPGGATIDRYDIRPDNSYYNTKHRYKLDNIVVNYKNVNIEKISFEYDENPSSRLKLKLFAIGKNPVVSKKYRFEYNPDLLPDLNSNSTDHWGYFNNRSINTSSIDLTDFEQVLNAYTQSRQPNFQLNEILEKIIYPTIGYSTFIYEPNTYSKTVDYDNGFSINNNNVNNTTGGFRIKEIIDFDGTSEKKKQYFYVNNYFGSSSNNLSSGTVAKIQSYATSSVIMQELSSVNAFNTTNSSHIIYSKVFEKLSNGAVTEYSFTNQDNGFMDRKASNFLTGCNFTLGFAGPPPSTSIGWGGSATEYYNPVSTFYKDYNSLESERAKLLSKVEYDSSGKKLTQHIYEYTSDPQRFEKYGRFLNLEIGDYGIYSEVAPAGTAEADRRYRTSLAKVSAYRMFFYNHYLKSETTTFYSGNNETTTAKNYFYNSARHGQLTSEEITLPDNTTNKTTFQYAADLRHANQPSQHVAPYQIIPSMINANMVGIPLIRSEYQNNVFQKRDELIYDVSQTTTNNFIVPKKALSYGEDVTFSSPGVGYPSVLLPSPDYAFNEISYDRYDNKGNLLQYTLKDNIPITIIWGYDQTKPIAKIEGVTYSELALKMNFQDTASGYLALPIVISSDFDTNSTYEKQNFIPELDNFKNNPILKDYQISTFSHDPLVGVTSITSPAGIKEYYTYDSTNKLERILDSNNKILKDYKYHYAPMKWYNKKYTQVFYKNNCLSWMVGQPYTYTVLPNTFMSVISQGDADQLAQNDASANGQTAANINGGCGFLSCGFTPNYYANVNFSSIQQTAPNHISMILTYSANPPSGMTYISGGVSVGYIGVGCRPSSTKTINSGNWRVIITTDGYVIVSALSGAPLPTQTVGFSVEYDK
ncbi:DUF5977 domain-containing protein [Chryseobacterium indoltheticum]|uniref:DUF5977 domain-containing protein n=1 Tax=Chryseobacterium indoltheticum TaxID=254 RepID=A0A381FIT9_9FLAO|nr:DUF5977 domain-containing protein [Chryseobacterium indoltheticum]SUX46393.1 Uncharacterised protein [Chryseobacterium indoltheticum]